MKTYMDCIPCFVRQSLEAARIGSDDPALQERIMREALKLAVNLDYNDTPPALGQKMHRLVRKIGGNPDPYAKIKKKSNMLALALLPDCNRLVRESKNPFETAVRLAIAGNIIDYGVNGALKDEQVNTSIREALHAEIDHAAIEQLRNAVKGAEDILYLGDNAGEIVLDRLLVEQLPREKLTYVVKGSPILNDVTMKDARQSGMTDLVEVIDNGSDAPGTILASCSKEFRQRFDKADLILAKGQGNYETLSNVDNKIFFLLKAKCPVIARDIGCDIGSLIVTDHV